MTKSLLTGIAVCAALAILAGNANARRAHVHKIHRATIPSTVSNPPIVRYYPLPPPVQYYPPPPPAGAWSWGMGTVGPLHDCVHIAFPQCSPHGADGPNDF